MNENIIIIISTLLGFYAGWWFTYKYFKGELKPFWKKEDKQIKENKE